MKKLFLLALLPLSVACSNAFDGNSTEVTIAGNSYITAGTQSRRGPSVGTQGIERWTDSTNIISSYIYLHSAGKYALSLNAKGNSEVMVSSNGKSYNVNISSDTIAEVAVGAFKAEKPGYIKIDFQGVTGDPEAGGSFGQIKSFNVYGIDSITHVHDFAEYWGRRGPSVHMSYDLPKGEDTEWFYNEVTVPEEGEVLSSYYMAAGFGEGYFGMQYNSEQERRVLFSVWSPFDTQDPKLIPEDERITMLRRGEDVYIGEFGNEGSGGQSFLRYNWKAGETYKFLMHIRPDGKGNTVYTAYFFATDDDEWRLIASFKRPKTDTWYKRPHSFLENFSEAQGYLTRSVNFANQWACTKDGKWIALHSGKFTHDATAAAGVRLDYQGGINDEGSFYLKMGGFFDESTKGNTPFESTYTGEQPVIDFDALKSIKDGEYKEPERSNRGERPDGERGERPEGAPEGERGERPEGAPEGRPERK